jgi:long-chain acyl-CoA synthetase
VLAQHFLEASSERYPDKVALIVGEQRLTWRQVDEAANRLAHALRTHGVTRGDRVAIYLPNTVEAAIAVFGVMKADAVFVVINPTTKADKLTYVLGDCAASALLAPSNKAVLARQMMDRVPSLLLTILCGPAPGSALTSDVPLLTWRALQSAHPAGRPPTKNIESDLACLIYTSGSTGMPKGVMTAHCNMIAASTSITTYLENRPDDIIINCLPFSFDYGLYQWIMTAQMGATLVLEKSFAFPHAVLKRLEKERVTGFPGVPTIFALLLRTDLSRYDLTSLRYITNTAAALPVSHIEELRDRFRGVRLYSMYGLTETKRTLYLPPDQLDIRPASVGIAIPGTEVWLENEAGRRLGPGEIGELVVRGPHVMRGYWNDPEASARRFRPGPLPGELICYTGDLFEMDEEGYLYFVSRKDDIIKSRGQKVSPKEVEEVLYRLDGVTEAVVLGAPDPILGEAIVAFIVTDGVTYTEREVKQHCAQHLEDYLIPQRVEFRDELPKTTSGKIHKHRFKEDVRTIVSG